MIKFWISGICAAASILLLAGCAPKKDPLPVSTGNIEAPYQEFDTASLFFYEKGIKRWRLEAEHMRKPLADTGSLVVVPVKISIFDSLGRPGSRILADSGSTDVKMETFYLWGNVFIRTDEGMVVKSPRLRWLKDQRKILSETYVQIETPKGDMLRGVGLDAVDNFSRFSFKKDVEGIFPNFKQRLEQDDDNFFN